MIQREVWWRRPPGMGLPRAARLLALKERQQELPPLWQYVLQARIRQARLDIAMHKRQLNDAVKRLDEYDRLLSSLEQDDDDGRDAASGRSSGGRSEPFPAQSLDFFDATTVNPRATGFQNADYDPGGRRVFFYPWGGIENRPSATLLAYHTDRNLFSTDSYDIVNLKTMLEPDAQGFGTGFLDSTHKAMFLVPFRKGIRSRIQPNDLAVRYDLSKDIHDKNSYETFHINSMPSPPPELGWITGAFINGHAYYMPYGTPTQGKPESHLHGYLLRYDSGGQFTNASAWSWFDLKSNIDPKAIGFQSVGVKAPWLYIVPYAEQVLVRYNVKRSFTEDASYEKVQPQHVESEGGRLHGRRHCRRLPCSRSVAQPARTRTGARHERGGKVRYPEGTNRWGCVGVPGSQRCSS